MESSTARVAAMPNKTGDLTQAEIANVPPVSRDGGDDAILLGVHGAYHQRVALGLPQAWVHHSARPK
jgi:hypothetical protein